MENKINAKTPNRIAELRKERGLLQRELGDILYIDQRTISNIEKGIGTLSNFVVLADFFGVSLDYILRRSNNRSMVLNVEEIDFQILEQLNAFASAEKERLLKHLELDNSLKNKNGN